MSWRSRLVNAVRGMRTTVERPRPGRVIRVESTDRWREYPADGLTPSRLASILRATDDGEAGPAIALYGQMEEKDAHLYSVATTRRLGVTGCPWRIVSMAETRAEADRALAEEAAAYCREVLGSIEQFDEALQHLSLAMGRNVAVAELVWDWAAGEMRVVDLVPIPFERVGFDELGAVRVLTMDEPVKGVALPANKLVVHVPQTVSGHPMRGGLLRASALAFLGKHFAVKDWMVFSEVFGMPLRIARYEPSATPEEKRELLAMLRSLGADAAGIFSKAVEVQFLEAGQGKAPPPYEAICNFFNRELSKAWLGETLTVDTAGTSGGLSVAQVHNEVRLDLRRDDIAREGRTVRRDVLAPLVRLRFGPDVPVPLFVRELESPRQPRLLAEVLSVAVNELGMRVPLRWAHEALGLPAAGEKDAGLSGKAG